mgnify:CR=1 FL=1
MSREYSEKVEKFCEKLKTLKADLSIYEATKNFEKCHISWDRVFCDLNRFQKSQKPTRRITPQNASSRR